MIAYLDVKYSESKTVPGQTDAWGAGIVTENFSSDIVHGTAGVLVTNVADYKPGLFFERELPVLLEILDSLGAWEIDTVVVDAYVHLDNNPGLGSYLYNALCGTVDSIQHPISDAYQDQPLSVVGVSKSHFSHAIKTIEVLRGESKQPLHVSSIGVITVEEAAEFVKSMNGGFRYPTMLRIVDKLSKAQYRGY